MTEYLSNFKVTTKPRIIEYQLLNPRNIMQKFFTLFGLLIVCFLFSCQANKNKTYTDWKVTGGSKQSIRYSSLTEIDTSNVSQLKVAWEYHTGDADTAKHSQIQ